MKLWNELSTESKARRLRIVINIIDTNDITVSSEILKLYKTNHNSNIEQTFETIRNHLLTIPPDVQYSSTVIKLLR